ncbi:tRNA dihydrouridine synthase [Hydrocarboniclastica marina]|uniref:tRNA-dihydrouridine(16) synthase n=1 Tax=Hydrocarboniclastica marina TaxID=2259620 RepID=A0A4V1D8W8_9ALTE|nr:tRNA-dihydrouridine synthase family protein [Hydrocarboniclastica marina]QCF26640.1 tRNA-dihydrouridine synthase family protein [Hydrocarboniclastica marina]
MPRLILAPMEGLVDPPMRDLVTRLGGVDQCVTEFIRVSGTRLPARVFHRIAPELLTGCRTAAGVPLIVQLLGSDAQSMADNACQAVKLGATAIDLNFGCPAKTVNKHKGGAILLREPERLAEITTTIRRALPEHIPLTAKMRLGYESPDRAVECAQALAAAGAAEITVHARTKTDGYRPPAYWPWIARIREGVPVPVVANGEIWTVEDYHRCREESGCEDVMIGRGLIARPDLALQIKRDLAGQPLQPMTWAELLPLINDFGEDALTKMPEKYATGRVKQWLTYLRFGFREAAESFAEVKRMREVRPLLAALNATLTRSGITAGPAEVLRESA